MTGHRRRAAAGLALLGILLAAALLARGAAAAAPPWPDMPFAYYAKNDPLASVLTNFGASVGTRVVVSRKIVGAVNGQFKEATPLAFLERLAKLYGLTWFYDNGVLSVYKADETKQRTLHIAPEGAPGLREALQQLGLIDPRYKLSIADADGVVVVAGPPAYTDAVATTAAAFAPQPVAAAPVMDFRIYRLRYASADDRSIFYRDKEVTIPGVASILRALATGDSGGGGGTQIKQLPATVIRLGGTGLIANGDLRKTVGIPPYPPAAPGSPDANAAPADAAATASADGGSGGAVIQADTRVNAVIVKDTKDRLPYYDRLIATLDVPVALVEIQATLVEVDTTHVADLGIRWQGQKQNVGTVSFGTPLAPTTGDQATGLNLLAVAGNVNLATLAANQASYFLTKVNALEQTGDARISSRPSVLTTDNLEALIDLSSTFYVKVAGAYQVDLFPVTVGTLLKVTPHVVVENGKPRIRVTIDIEDGSVDAAAGQTVDGIPRVSRNTIGTEATVTQDESLLIGGHYFEQEAGNVNKVPFLGDIPGIGFLFQEKEKNNEHRQRLFLITPRIIEMPRT